MKSSTTQTISTAAVVSALKQKIDDVLADIITPGQPFAVLDFPDYDNIGDSAIYHGEMAYLRKRSMFPSYVCTTNNCSWEDMETAIGNGQILLQGGGNFGDIWPWFQPFREEVLTRYRGTPVVQFPQTIYYESQERLDQTARIIDRHGAFTLLVRDQRSYDLATRAFQCDVRLCPDMAFQIDVSASEKPQYDLLLHLREDKEAAANYNTGHLTAQANVIRQDWPPENDAFLNRIDRASRPARALAYLKHGRRGTAPVRYARRARARFERGAELLQQSRYVITDRLHGHIMCVLLGIPHCVIDNSYGKTSGFMDAWGTRADNVYIAADIAEAVRVLQTEAGLDIAI